MSDIEQRLREQANIIADDLDIPAEITYLWQAADHIAALEQRIAKLQAQPVPTDEQIERVILEHLGWPNDTLSFYESVTDAAKAIAALQGGKDES